MADRILSVSWPGVASPLSCSYTLSHGITPGCAQLTCLPVGSIDGIALHGDLQLSDGIGTLVLKGCRVARVRQTQDDSGILWHLEINDRRWRWRDAPGFISGTYNVVDSGRDVTRPPPEMQGPFLANAELYVPWTVKLPHELLALCLDAMGETGYSFQGVPNTSYPLPAIDWRYENPAQALSSLVERLGCRIIYRPDTDTVWIRPVGVGLGLPDSNDMTREAPSVKAPSRPDSLLLVGAPVKFQMEWELEAVGEDWDGSIKPIEALIYAPATTVTIRHTITVTPSALTAGTVLTITIRVKGEDYSASYTTVGTSVATAVTNLVTQVLAAVAHEGFTATDGTTLLTVQGPADGTPFTLTTSSSVAGNLLRWELVAKGASSKGKWINQGPPGLEGARAVDGVLTQQEAWDRARRSVYRMYRITNTNIENGLPGAVVPDFGVIDLAGGIWRVQLLSEQIEQTVPLAADQQVVGRNGYAITRDFYDGLFKAKPARCFGRYTQADAGLLRVNDSRRSSGADDEVMVDFSIDAARRLVIFNEPVFLYIDGGWFFPAKIRLRCACHVRRVGDNSLVRYENTYTFPGPKLGTKPAVIRHEDVQYLVKGVYETQYNLNVEMGRMDHQRLLKDTLTNIGEVAERANYYLLAAAAKYQTPLSGERSYNGIHAIFCDGAIQQVSWSVNCESGAETTASLNFEHVIYAPQYPERLRLEYLRELTSQAPAALNAQQMAGPGTGPPGAGPGSGYVSGGGG